MNKPINPEQLLHLSTLILRGLVDGGSARHLAEYLCEEAELLLQGFAVGIMTLDANAKLQLYAASKQGQRLQAQFEATTAAVQGCNRCAVTQYQHALVVQDTALDTACTPCYLTGWQGPWSCWSYPILDRNSIVGCLRITCTTHQKPTANEASALDNLASIAGMLLCFQRSQQQQRLQEQSLRRFADFQGMLAHANALVANASNTTTFLQEICDCLTRFAHLRLVWICRPDANGVFQILAASGTTGYLDGIFISSRADLPEGGGSVGITWREAVSMYVDSISANPQQAPWLQRVMEWGLNSSAALPVFRNKKIWAVLVAIHSESNVFDRALREVLEELARNLSRGLDRLALRESETRLNALQKHLLDSTQVGMTMVRNRHFILTNSCFARMLGYESAEELNGRSTHIIYPDPETYQKLGELYINQPTNTKPQAFFEFNLRHKDNSVSPFEVTYTLNEDSEGPFSIWTIMDISERVRRNQELNSYRDQLLRYAERIHGMLYKFRLGPDGAMSFPIALGAVQLMLGESAQTLQKSAEPAFARLHPEDYFFVASSIQISARDMTPWHLECRLIMPEGQTVWRSGFSVPEKEEDGGVVWYGFITDITEQKRVQEALISSEAQQRALFVASPVAMAVVDGISLTVQSVNPAWEQLLLRNASSLVGRTLLQSGLWAKVVDESLVFQSTPPAATTTTTTTTATCPLEMQLLRGDGQPILCRVSTARTGQTPRSPVLMIAEDITLQRAIEQEISSLNLDLENRVQQRTMELEASNDALQESLVELQVTQKQLVEVEKLSALGRLVAGVAHEINTPVGNGLLAATNIHHLVQELKSNSQQGLKRSLFENFLHQSEDAAAIVVRNLQKAAELITTFKQVAVDQNLHSNCRQFALLQLIQDHLSLLHPRLKVLPVRLHVDVPESIELHSYPGPLGQIITNMINNALDHAFENQPPQQDIWITGRPCDTDWVELQFRDNGRGIPDTDMSHIFEPFFTTRLGRGGSGLGLHICHNAALALGGRFHVSSTHGEGSCFTLKIPLEAPQSPAAASEYSAPL